MGMFDTLKCEYPLPDKIVQKDSFQTKSLDSLLENYTITKEGKLILHEEQDGVSIKNIEIDFHGDLHFHTSTGSAKENNYERYDFTARFAEGNLIWVKRDEWNK